MAAADIDSHALSEFCEEFSIPASRAYSHHDEMLAEEDLDILSVATPSFLHHDHVIDATQAAASPRAIWCEKPIALSVSEAEQMMIACEESNTRLVINHQRRFADEYRALRAKLHEEQLLGDLESVHTHSPRELLRNGTHTVDLITFLLDERIASVAGYLTGESGLGDPDDQGDVQNFDDSGGGGVLVSEGGVYVTIDQTVPRPISKGYKTLVGTGGTLHMPSRDQWVFHQLEDDPEGPYGASHVESPLPAGLEITSNQEKFTNGARHLVDLIEGNAENWSSGEDATHVLEIIVAIFVSHYLGSRVSLPLDRPLRDVRILSG